MAHIETSSGGRSTNVDLNLVPFIDLMSCLITFLLISAVWTQVSMIQLGASFTAPKDPSSAPPAPPPKDDILLRLDVVDNGYVLKVGTTTKSLPKKNQIYDAELLKNELDLVKKTHPAKTSMQIAIADRVVYEHVIKVMDVGLKSGFSPELLTGGPN